MIRQGDSFTVHAEGIMNTKVSVAKSYPRLRKADLLVTTDTRTTPVTREIGQSFRVGYRVSSVGHKEAAVVTITVIRVEGTCVRVCINAPRWITITRDELKRKEGTHESDKSTERGD